MPIKQQAFSVIELVIAISIIAILTTIVMANFHDANKSKSVQLGADAIASAFRTAQENSLNPKEISAISCSQGKVPGEYHLIFNITQPTIFTLTAKDKCGNPGIVLQTFNLPKNVVINTVGGLKIDGAAVASPLDFKFETPFAKATISSGSAVFRSFTQGEVVLAFNDGSFTRHIILDGLSGRVDIQ
ncbi:MAG: type II secretion system GspH family protein [Candidatus Doudnabacteria bacterium]|nr:type II secretion system GspH family protein [Candidatus Doudnabacteria bacterium]